MEASPAISAAIFGATRFLNDKGRGVCLTPPWHSLHRSFIVVLSMAGRGGGDSRLD